MHVRFTRVIGWEGRAGKIDLEIGKEILADRANFTAKTHASTDNCYKYTVFNLTK
jgi:hypothetical protein